MNMFTNSLSRERERAAVGRNLSLKEERTGSNAAYSPRLPKGGLSDGNLEDNYAL